MVMKNVIIEKAEKIELEGFGPSIIIYFTLNSTKCSIYFGENKNGKAIRLNTEHKITLDIEVERIINSGSTIQNNRISGRLNLTRAIGI